MHGVTLSVVVLGPCPGPDALLATRLAAHHAEPWWCPTLADLHRAPTRSAILLVEWHWLTRLSLAEQAQLSQQAGERASWLVWSASPVALPAQLHWKRQGVSGFCLLSPPDLNPLLARIDTLLDSLAGPPLRVLLLDQADSLALHAPMLRQVGLQVLTLADPLQLLASLEAYHPDVLLIGASLPDCAAPDLLGVLRQTPQGQALPVLVLADAEQYPAVLHWPVVVQGCLLRPLTACVLRAQITAQGRAGRERLRVARLAAPVLTELALPLEPLRQAVDEHAIVSVADVNGNIIHINDKFCEISGYTREELLGHSHRLVKSHWHPQAFYDELWQTISSGHNWHGEVCNRRKNGELYWVEASIFPVLDEQGLPVQYLSIRTDITHLKAVEQALQEKEARYRSLVDTVADGIVLYDPNGQVIECNPAAEQILGLRREQILGHSALNPIWRCVYPDGRPCRGDAHPVMQTLATGLSQQNMLMGVERPDASLVWVSMSSAPIAAANARQTSLGVVVSFSDVTRIREMDRAARESLSKLEATIRAIPDPLFEMDRDGRYCDIHPSDIGLLAAPVHALLGKTVDDVLEPKAASTVHQAIAEAAAQGVSYGHQIWVTTPRGRRCFELSLARKLLPEQADALRFVLLARDVTERKHIEARYAFAVEGAGDGVWDWNMLTGDMPLSGHYEDMLGFAKGELPPSIEAWKRSVHPDDWDAVQQALNGYLDGQLPNYAVELRLRCKDGSYKWILCRGTVVERDSAGAPVRMIGIHSDISERKRAEEALLVFRRLVETTNQAIRVADAAGRIQYVNPAYEQLLGYTLAEVADKPFTQTGIVSEEQVLVNEILERLQQGGGWQGFLKLRDKGGREFVSLSNIRSITSPDTGELLHSFNMFVDYSEEIARQEALEQAVAQANAANQAKSTFLSSMSHELRTPMNAIIGFAQMLEYDSELNADQQDNVYEILKAGHHLLALINEVLDLAKIESGRINLSLESVELLALADECCQLIQPLATPRGIQIQLEIPADIQMRADRVRLKQVLLNLLSNAIKYNRENGQIHLHAHAQGSYVQLSVADTGIGIPPERLTEVFQPFNRLNAECSEVEGTGIGLTITQRLVEMMDGHIGVESQPDVGSRFWVELPAEHYCPPELAGEALEADDEAEPMASASVLCIDDNPVNLKLVAQILGMRPHLRLMTAHAPELGIELALGHLPDLILLDINMPGMDGYQVLDVLKSSPRLKHIPVVAVTANAMPRDIARGKQAGFADYLTKPLHIHHFLQVLDALLATPAVAVPEAS